MRDLPTAGPEERPIVSVEAVGMLDRATLGDLAAGIASNLYEVEWEISLRNHKKEDVTVTVIEPMPGDWEVLRSTHPHEKVEAHTLRFRLPVAKDSTTKLTYRVRLRF